MYEEQELFKFFSNYKHDLIRNDEQRVSEYLSQEFDCYLEDLKTALKGKNNGIENLCKDIESNLDLIENYCTRIVEIIAIREKGYLKQAYDKAFDLFDEWEQYIVSFRFLDDKYYRIRKGDFSKEKENKQRKELFHIPLKLNHIASKCRYSIPGHPCLYLSNGLPVSWFETNLPNKFSYSVFNRCSNAFKLIDFSIKPFYFPSDYLSYTQHDKKFGLKYIISFPIQTACSLKVKNRNDHFVAEYVFPQMLLQWLLEKTKYDGIKYTSALNNEAVKEYRYVNYVFPVREYRKDGFDKKLVDSFEMSDVEYVELKDYFEEREKLFNEAKKIRESLGTSKGDLYIQKLIKLFDSLEFCKNQIINEIDKDNTSKENFINLRNSYRKLCEIEDNHLIIDSNANELINKVKELHYDVIPLFLGKKECKNFKKIREED